MIIGMDATPLSLTSGGIRRYTEELAHALATEFPQDTLVLLSDQPFSTSLKLSNLLLEQQKSRNPLARRWWSIGIHSYLRKYRVDVFHGTNFSVPYVPLKPAVLTIHDLSPWMETG